MQKFNMTKLRFLILIALLSFGCSVQVNQPNTNTATAKPENVSTPNTEPMANATVANNAETPNPPKTEKTNSSSCFNAVKDDLMLDKKQTFPIDFPPFEKSCFVTFHNPEFENPPLGSQFYIYKNGTEVFEFPEQFGMSNAMCWADAVSFEDVNNDGLKDVLIVGKCGEKSGGYNENMVYLNNGKEFVTNAEANAELLDFSRINQIKDFVKKNPKMFVP
jgi:hypothetical protein